MKIYKHNTNSITINGQSFEADGDGIIDIPDYLRHGAVLQGFVSAKGRTQQQANAAPVAQDSIAPASPPPLPGTTKADNLIKTTNAPEKNP